jgi:outer membrane protein OmpA-like peptidoglycan-associated protein
MAPERQIDEPQAKLTDRGWVLTLGDVLFESGRAALHPDTGGNLNKLIAFLDTYPDRAVTIEGYTDNRGSQDGNHSLSQRRADAVQSYAIKCGVRPTRLVALGKGASAPVASNDTEQGRLQNRRVEVIIGDPEAVLG